MRQQRTSRLRATVQPRQPVSGSDILWRIVAIGGPSQVIIEVTGVTLGICIRRAPEFTITGTALTASAAAWLPVLSPSGNRQIIVTFDGVLPSEFEMQLTQTTDAVMNAIGGRLAAAWAGYPVSPGAAPLLLIASIVNDPQLIDITWASNAPFMLAGINGAIQNTTTNENGKLTGNAGLTLTWEFLVSGLNTGDNIQIGGLSQPIVSSWGERILNTNYIIGS